MYVGGTKPAAEGKDVGEFFQYAVTAPVSVKRGESALVPIIGSEIKYERELLYNRAKLPDHPVVALRFDNSTGLTLERGPVTVVENVSRPDQRIHACEVDLTHGVADEHDSLRQRVVGIDQAQHEQRQHQQRELATPAKQPVAGARKVIEQLHSASMIARIVRR